MLLVLIYISLFILVFHKTGRVTYEACISTLRHNRKSAGKRQGQCADIITMHTSSGLHTCTFSTDLLWLQ